MAKTTTKRLLIDDIAPGMRLAKTIFFDDAKVVLEAGTLITPGIIARLRNRGIHNIDILSERMPSQPQPFRQIPTRSYRKFSSSYKESVKALNSAFDNIRQFKKVPGEALRDFSDKVVFNIINTPGALNFVQLAYQQDGPMFQHSLDVAIIAGVFGRWLGLQGAVLNDLVLAGLLHDIGKTVVPAELLNKPGSLTEEEAKIVRSHTLLGYKLLSDAKTLPASVVAVALQHHERLDGSGYPFHLTSEKIHPFSQIIAIAEMYDTMITKQPYRAKMSPIEALKEIQSEMFTRLDPTLCSVFLENIKAYLIGNVVQLNDGRTAELIYLAEYMTHRPLVRSEDGQFINLETSKDLYIVNMPALETEDEIR